MAVLFVLFYCFLRTREPFDKSHGFWENKKEAASEHAFDAALAEALYTFFQQERVQSLADLGCGKADYVKYFRKRQLPADGFDGNPQTPQITNGVARVLDLAEAVRFPRPFDWLMSLEVGEHLPQVFEDIFIGNLHNNNKRGIVLSWAVEGQGGHGHVNERNNDYIRAKIEQLGYVSDPAAESFLRHRATLPWFKQTIMVFRKNYPKE